MLVKGFDFYFSPLKSVFSLANNSVYNEGKNTYSAACGNNAVAASAVTAVVTGVAGIAGVGLLILFNGYRFGVNFFVYAVASERYFAFVFADGSGRLGSQNGCA